MKDSPITEKHFTCSICNAECGFIASINRNTVTAIKPDRNHPLSQGYCCPKGLALARVVNDPDRVRTPLKRVGNEFVPISWKQALQEIAGSLREILTLNSPHAIAYYYGTNAAHSFSHAMWVKAFMGALGSQNVYSAGSVDSNNKFVAQCLLYGSSAIMPFPDFPKTDFLILIGTNPAATNLSLVTCANVMKVLRGILARGGEIYVIDPRKTDTANILTKNNADHYVPIWPNTDIYLLLAMIQHIFASGLEDRTFLAQNTRQVDQLREVVKSFTPEAVAPICKIPSTLILYLAETFARTKSAAIYGRLGTSLSDFNTLNAWAIDVLHVICGHFDCPGGLVFGRNILSIARLGKLVGMGAFDTHKSRVGHFPSVMGDLPVGTLAREITAPRNPVQGLFVSGGNPVLTTPNTNELKQALARLRLCVVLDFYMNETALAFAHYVLPVTTVLERFFIPLYLLNYQTFPHIEFNEAVVNTPPNGPRDEWEILGAIIRLIHRPFFGNALFDIVNRVIFPINKRGITPRIMLRVFLLLGQIFAKRFPHLSPDALTFRQLRQKRFILLGGQEYGVLGRNLQTPEKKISLLDAHILPQLEKCHSTFLHLQEPPTTREKGQYLLVNGRDLRTANSWMHNATVISEPRMWIHPADAAKLNVFEGEVVALKTSEGKIFVPIHQTTNIMEGVVYYPHGWGHRNPRLSRASRNPGENVNELTDSATLDTLSGIPRFNGTPVTIGKQN